MCYDCISFVINFILYFHVILQLTIHFFKLNLGNGPSAITLSYMLAGNVPYYEGTSSDEFLHARLSQAVDQPLVLQELQFLSDVSYFLFYCIHFRMRRQMPFD